MDGEAAPAAWDAVSRVLENDDLLAEILLRVGLPALVRAAAVCRRWLGHASEPGFLRRFRELHSPLLLRFYLEDFSSARADQRFVSVLEGLQGFGGGGMRGRILDCRNGRFLTQRCDGDMLTCEVHIPLCPGRGVVALPPPPSSRGYSGILSDGLSYFHVSMESARDDARLGQVHILRDGAWRAHSLATAGLPPRRLEVKPVFAGGNIFMAAALRDIVVMDLTTSSFSVIQLPQGLEYWSLDTMLSPADDASGVYAVHLRELQVRVWLHDGDAWSLVDPICLRGMLANLNMPRYSANEYHAGLRLALVGDNAEFVFLHMHGYMLYLDVRCRTLRTVHESLWYEDARRVNPLMMTWPPTFPTLKDYHARTCVRG